MNQNQQGLEELVKQKKQFQQLKNLQPKNKEKNDQDLQDFIVNDIDDDEYYANDSQEEEKKKIPENQQQITQFMGQNRKKKQTGIKLNDDLDEVEQVIQQSKVEKISVKQVVTNSDDLYKAQFNEPLKPTQHQQLQEEDLDEIFNVIQVNNEKQQQQQQQQPKSQQQQAKEVNQKPLPLHRKVEVNLEATQVQFNQSTINQNYIISKDRDTQDIVEKDQSILFYWIDIYEDQTRFPGSLFLFGKVKNQKLDVYDSCSLFFEDYHKTIYLSYENEKYTEQQLLQECSVVMKKYLGLGQKDYTCQFVYKQYAFEIADISTSKQQYLEVSYTLKHGSVIPVRIESHIFRYALQSTQTLTEQFLIYNNIRGPCWLQIKQCKNLVTKEFYLKTQHQLQLEKNGFQVYEQGQCIPNLKLLSFCLTQCKMEKDEQIIAISYTVQTNIDQNDDEVPEQVFHYTLARMPNDDPLPPGYIKSQNKQVKDFETEYSMISFFLQTVEQIDPDGFVGHDIQKKNIDQLFARVAKLKINEWNRLSRLQKREQMPKNNFLRNKYIMIGRLVIDLWVQASNMIKSNDYSITYLAKEFLKQDTQDFLQLESDVTKSYTENAKSYQILLQLSQRESKYIMQIMQKLNIISLTRELTIICGNVWNRSLLNQRAERNEMLLMHEFYSRGYILPDKMSKINLSDEEKEYQIKEQESKKTYGGGLVFEPKADIYTQYVLLLDFNSLYPSIIMEYNICFTTVQRDKINFEIEKKGEGEEIVEETKTQKTKNNKKKKQNIQEETDQNEQNQEFIGQVDPEAQKGILPQIIEKLVDMRKQAKRKMASSKGLMQKIYNIKQLAIKLVANSIYGCLGFSSSRFYAIGIASLITKKGRQILLDSKATVERQNDVIYGDTDSMMICARSEKDLKEILELGTQIAKEINKKYKKLVLAIDGVFQTLLLIKKKKYAGIKIDNLDDLITGKSNEEILKREVKGIDIVRREFCDISKKLQSKVLDIILQTKNREDIHKELVTLMHEIRKMFDYLSGYIILDVNQLISENKYLKETILTSDFIIVKQLNKAPHEYADSMSLPHVQVALRMVNVYGRSSQSLAHHFIRFIICEDPSIKNVSQRAFTAEELEAKNLTIDYQYYLSTQIFDPIVRLCKNIQVVSISELAQILGLKSYQQKIKLNNNISEIKFDEEETNLLKNIENFVFKCPVCKEDQKYSLFFDKQGRCVMQLKCQTKQCTYSTDNLKSISNQTKLKIKKEICNQYYKGYLQCKSTIQTNFCLQETCFGDCCQQENKNKKLKQKYEEDIVNDQVNLLTQFSQKVLSEINKSTAQQQHNSKARQYQIQEDKQFTQPYCVIKLNDLLRKFKI